MSEDAPDAEAAEDAAAAPEAPNPAAPDEEDTRERRPEGALKERRNARDLPTDDMTEQRKGKGRKSDAESSTFSDAEKPKRGSLFGRRTDFREKISPWAPPPGREGSGLVGDPLQGSSPGLDSREFGESPPEEFTCVCS